MPEQERPRSTMDVLVESERLLIRRAELEDSRSLERVFCEAEMMRYLGGAWDADKVADATQEWRDDWGVEHRWYGVLLRKDTWEIIGTAGVTENTIPDEAGLELSWFVLPEHQRQGFATEITVELLRFAFEALRAERVVAETHPENPASRRVLEKLRFKCLGEQHHSYDYLPGFETQVLWELRRGSWRANAS
ncbi:MAG: GNAT family N-acetyltransferase [Chloroflexota bacterium]